jgi:hypothetical protein
LPKVKIFKAIYYQPIAAGKIIRVNLQDDERRSRLRGDDIENRRNSRRLFSIAVQSTRKIILVNYQGVIFTAVDNV